MRRQTRSKVKEEGERRRGQSGSSPGKGTRVRLGKEESRREGSPNDTDPTKLYRLLYLNEEYASNTNRPPETKGAPVRIISAIVILFDRRSRPFGPPRAPVLVSSARPI